jgi:hypothetical protein
MNSNEQIVADYLSKKGHRVIRRGWPDFLCVKQQYNRILKEYTGNFSGVLAVEVKSGRDQLSEDQKIVHAVLKLAGIPTYTIRPEDMDKALAPGRLKLWSTEEVNRIQQRIYALEAQAAASQKEMADLRGLINDCAILFDETNFILEGAKP